jgi:hypothetical protein
MSSLFISYSRKDIEFARRFTEDIKGQEFDVWIDWEGIPPTVDWWKQIQKGIEEADVFVFLMSPDSAKSKTCRQEIEYAAHNGKRLIPVVVRDIRAEESPNELQLLNWIFLRESDDFNSGFGKLITAIRTDYAWVQDHNRLQNKSLEWERNNKESSFLLRGRELQEMEIVLEKNASKEPHATKLQYEYVLNSRRAMDQQRRFTIALSIGIMIALTALSLYAFAQARAAREAQSIAEQNAAEAQRQAILSRSSQLGSQAQALMQASQPIEAFRLNSFAIAASNTVAESAMTLALLSNLGNTTSLAVSPDGKFLASTLDEKISLWDVNQPTSDPIILAGHEGSIQAIAFSPDGRYLASGGFDPQVILWDLSHISEGPAARLLGSESLILDIEFSPDGKIVAAAGSDDTIFLWDTSSGKLINRFLTGAVVTSIAVSPDGTMLASGTVDSYVTLWDVATGRDIGVIYDVDAWEVNYVEFSPDGRLLAVSSTSGFALWDLAEPSFPILRDMTGNFNEVTFSPDGRLLAVGSADRTIHILNIEKPEDSPVIIRTNEEFAAVDWLR